MLDLRPRPLTSDAPLYVERDADKVVRRAVEARQNVLVGAARGAGTTSLLNRLETELPDAIHINADRADQPTDVLASLASRLHVPRGLFSDSASLFDDPDPLATPPIVGQIRAALEQAGRHPVILVDGPIDPGVAFELFGRWRDDLFSMPATWVVAAHEHRLAEYLTPPADVFFDTVVKLDPLSEMEAMELLQRRDALGELSDNALSSIVGTFDGTPRHLLRLAQSNVTSSDRDPLEQIHAHAKAIEDLSRGAHMLLAEMQGRGPVAATDADLRNRLGVTDRQLRRNLAELALHGLVEIVPGARPGPGRPPSVFRLTDVGEIRWTT
jgi:hypothetical protein